VTSSNAITSPWTLPSPYWIAVSGAAASSALRRAAEGCDMQARTQDDRCYYVLQTPPEWVSGWQTVEKTFSDVGEPVMAALIAADHMPEIAEIIPQLRPLSAMNDVVQELWLLDQVSEDRLRCYLQRVVDRRGKTVGYEAFARIVRENGEVISGAAIMRASHALKIEYQVDRRMQKLAVSCFAHNDLEGFLFVNFLTGFIHRPEIYFEGLSQAVDAHGLLPRNVVLDIPLGAYTRDLSKLRSIAAYCQTRGFSLAFDDVQTPEALAQVLNEIHPAFLKLDASLASAITDTRRHDTVHAIIRMAHESGASIVAESVESEALYQAYLSAGVELFQGYHFGAPQSYSHTSPIG
jgi:EAL domain-containing protein (putative c-di-GMP-specific phosphodiesterase class I)